MSTSPSTPASLGRSTDPDCKPRRHPRLAPTALFVAIAAVFLTGCEESRYGLPDPATNQADHVLQLWRVSFYGALGLGALVVLLIAYSLLRHRRRSDDLPKQTEGHALLELTYTMIPFILVGLLFAYGIKVQVIETKLTKSPDVKIDATGYQWNWLFNYPDENVNIVGAPQVVPGNNEALPTIVLPVNEKIRFNLIAADVAHSFFIPGFLTKRDLIPGVRNEIEVTPNRTGLYMGHCAEFCGLNHSQMNFQVRVVPHDEYVNWLSQQKGQARA